MADKTFDRFKVAEAFAHELHAQGRYFIMTNEFGVTGEDGYLQDTFTVRDLAPAPAERVGQVGTYVGRDK